MSKPGLHDYGLSLQWLVSWAKLKHILLTNLSCVTRLSIPSDDKISNMYVRMYVYTHIYMNGSGDVKSNDNWLLRIWWNRNLDLQHFIFYQIKFYTIVNSVTGRVMFERFVRIEWFVFHKPIDIKGQKQKRNYWSVMNGVYFPTAVGLSIWS